MDFEEINGMNKKELAAELRAVGMSGSGTKAELKRRLKEHRKEKGRKEDESGNEDDEKTEEEDAIEKAMQIEKEIEEKRKQLEALQASIQSSTNRKVSTLTTSSTSRNKLRQDSVHFVNVTVPERQPNMMSMYANTLSFKDIEDSLKKFNGDDAYKVKCWAKEVEQNSAIFGWNELQKFVFAKKLLEGTAKRFLRTIDVTNWEELKEELIEEFDAPLSSAEAHKKLRETKKASGESYHEYVLKMHEIGKENNVDEKSIIQYIIGGIDDDH